ncbi:MAG: hypothetical protein PVF65_06130 [Sphingomonadales bacterium]
MDTIRPFSVGTMVSQSLGLLFKQILKYLPIGIALFIIPVILMTIYVSSELNLETISDPSSVNWEEIAGPIAIVLLLSTLTYYFYAGFIIAHSSNHLASEDISVKAALLRAGAVFVPLIVLYLIITIGTFAGYILLFIPGIFLSVIWAAAPAVAVYERVGPIKALGRSYELSKGYRWSILGFFLLIILLYFAIAMALGLLQILFAVPLAYAGDASTAATILYGILEIPSNYMSFTIFPLASSVLYVELRRVKEGFGGQGMLDTFD